MVRVASVIAINVGAFEDSDRRFEPGELGHAFIALGLQCSESVLRDVPTPRPHALPAVSAFAWRVIVATCAMIAAFRVVVVRSMSAASW